MAHTTDGEEQAERMLQGSGEAVASVHSQQHQRRYLQTHPISRLRRHIRRPRRTGMEGENCDIRGIENFVEILNQFAVLRHERSVRQPMLVGDHSQGLRRRPQPTLQPSGAHHVQGGK